MGRRARRWCCSELPTQDRHGYEVPPTYLGPTTDVKPTWNALLVNWKQLKQAARADGRTRTRVPNSKNTKPVRTRGQHCPHTRTQTVLKRDQAHLCPQTGTQASESQPPLCPSTGTVYRSTTPSPSYDHGSIPNRAAPVVEPSGCSGTASSPATGTTLFRRASGLHPRLTPEALARDAAEIGLPAIVRTLLREGSPMAAAPFHPGGVALGVQLGVIERREPSSIAATADAPRWLRQASARGWSSPTSADGEVDHPGTTANGTEGVAC